MGLAETMDHHYSLEFKHSFACSLVICDRKKMRTMWEGIEHRKGQSTR